MSAKKSNNRMLLLVNGIIALLYSVLALFAPEDTLLTIIKFFGIAMVVFGIVMLIAAIKNAQNKVPFFSDLAWAILILAIGGLLSFNTKQLLEIFVVIIGFWAILLGLAQLVLLVQGSLGSVNKKIIIINGLLTLIFGVILFLNPFSFAKFFVILSGVMAFIIAVLLIILAFKLNGVAVNEKTEPEY